MMVFWIVLGVIFFIALLIYYIVLFIDLNEDYYEDGKKEFCMDLMCPFRYWARSVKEKINRLDEKR